MKKIKLAKNKYALVDDEDFEIVNKYKWQDNGYGYARRTIRTNNKYKTLYMHRFILGIYDTKIQVDHIDRNKLNNQKHNLRLATRNQNMRNTEKHKIINGNNTSSKYKGVHWSKKSKKWCAQIKVNGKFIYLGLYKNEKSAALAYNKAAKKHFGEYALLNSVKED